MVSYDSKMDRRSVSGWLLTTERNNPKCKQQHLINFITNYSKNIKMDNASDLHFASVFGEVPHTWITSVWF